MKDRLQKIIAARGITSRRKAEEMISAGRVSVNGTIASLGDTADPEKDRILLDGRLLPSTEKYVYIMLHKPRGYVTTLSDEHGRKDVAQLVHDCGVRVYPVGRLDMDSEGLLLFTNDGEFANNLMHPKHEVNKTYRVTVDGYSDAALEKLRKPVTLDGYTIRTPEVALLEGPDYTGRAVLQVVIHEGRNRQVRRMCAMAGMTVQRLVRTAEGAVQLGTLPLGKWRYLKEEEIAGLK